MANNNAYLNNNNHSTNLRDWQHAARMFTDSNQIYGPKQKFLFHVAFHINKAALRNISIGTTYSTQINMLVKSISLPKFTILSDKVNQYNRKKNIQQKVTYEDITVKFHDDNLGLINQLWQNYFNYYYADSSSAGIPGAYNRTAIKKFNYIRSNYGFDNGATTPFFDYITIYQMAQGSYVSYKLINPIFASWNHNNLDYSSGANPHDNDCTIQYEAVEYGSGKVQPGDPEGFALQNYDLSPSPLSSADLTNSPVDANSTTPSLSDINTIPNNRSGILNNLIQTQNTYTNTKTVSTAPTTSVTTPTPLNTSANTNTGTSFAKGTAGNTTTSASTSGLSGGVTGTAALDAFINGPAGTAGLQSFINDVRNAKTPADAAALKAKAEASIAAGKAAITAAGYTQFTYNGYTGYY
jgi:hypothetical protein